MPPWQAQKAKIQLKLSIQRLELVQKKKEAIAKQTRRDIADLLAKGKLETAKVRTEVIISDEITIELLELLSLYAELLIARFPLLDNSTATAEPDAGVKEAVASIMFAAGRTEVKELQVLRDLLMHKYSRDFAVATMSNANGDVNERVVKKLEIFRPPPELIDGYLDAISEHYKVGWSSGRGQVPDGEVPSAEFEGVKEGEESAESTAEGGEKAPSTATAPTTTTADAAASTSTAPAAPPPSYEVVKEKPLTDEQLLAARFEALKKR